MLKSYNQMPEPTLQDGSMQQGEVPEDDLVVALAAEIDALAIEIEERREQREKLIQWRRELLQEAQAAAQ